MKRCFRILPNAGKAFVLKLGRPTLGGKLTILNCTFWAVSTLFGSYTGELPTNGVYGVLAIMMSFPFAFCLLPHNLRHSHLYAEDAIVCSIVIGVNSIAWGYVLAWLWSLRPRKWPRESPASRRRRFGLCPSCGYDLRATPNRCPECGTSPAGGPS